MLRKYHSDAYSFKISKILKLGQSIGLINLFPRINLFSLTFWSKLCFAWTGTVGQVGVGREILQALSNDVQNQFLCAFLGSFYSIWGKNWRWTQKKPTAGWIFQSWRFFEATECETLTAFAASEYNHNFRGDDATYQPTQSEGILYSCCRWVILENSTKTTALDLFAWPLGPNCSKAD